MARQSMLTEVRGLTATGQPFPGPGSPDLIRIRGTATCARVRIETVCSASASTDVLEDGSWTKDVGNGEECRCDAAIPWIKVTCEDDPTCFQIFSSAEANEWLLSCPKAPKCPIVTASVTVPPCEDGVRPPIELE